MSRRLVGEEAEEEGVAGAAAALSGATLRPTMSIASAESHFMNKTLNGALSDVPKKCHRSVRSDATATPPAAEGD